MAFLQTSGDHFTLNGVRHMPFGAAMYGSSNSTTDIQNRIDEAVANHLNILRYINYMNAGDIYNAAVWARVDYLLDAARTAGIKVLLDLSDYCAKLLGDAVTPGNQNWIVFADFLLNRVNTINGRVYKNDDTIAIITIAGELDPQYNSEMVAFYTHVTQTMKAIDSNHLLNATAEPYHPLAGIAAIPTLDMIGTHNYGATDGTFATYRIYAQAAGKPYIIEEFGTQAKRGDVGWASYMESNYKMGMRHGCAGFLFWNWFPATANPTSASEDYNIGPAALPGTGSPRTLRTVKLYSYIKSYSPRIPVAAAEQAGYPG